MVRGVGPCAEREAAARLAVTEERARIAREMHDVVAHAISVVVLQVDAVRHNLPAELAAEQDALRGAEDAGREVVPQMRGLLGALRDAEEELERAPQPGLDDLGPLVEDVRRTGPDRERARRGRPGAAAGGAGP